MGDNKKTLLLIFLLAIAVWAGWNGYNYYKGGKTSKAVPENFPKEIPIEKGANISNAFSQSTDENNSYALVEFDSKKSLDDSFKIYSDFLAENGWDITESLNEPSVKSLRAVKGSDSIYISIYFNEATNGNAVAINFTDSTEPSGTPNPDSKSFY